MGFFPFSLDLRFHALSMLPSSSWAFGDQDNLSNPLSFPNPFPQNPETHVHKSFCMKTHWLQGDGEAQQCPDLRLKAASPTPPPGTEMSFPLKNHVYRERTRRHTPVSWGHTAITITHAHARRSTSQATRHSSPPCSLPTSLQHLHVPEGTRPSLCTLLSE